MSFDFCSLMAAKKSKISFATKNPKVKGGQFWTLDNDICIFEAIFQNHLAQMGLEERELLFQHLC